jgi:hypothetical protein
MKIPIDRHSWLGLAQIVLTGTVFVQKATAIALVALSWYAGLTTAKADDCAT